MHALSCLATILLISSAGSSEAANPSPKDLSQSNFRSLLRMGGSTQSPTPQPGSPSAPSAPAPSDGAASQGGAPGGGAPAAGGPTPTSISAPSSGGTGTAPGGGGGTGTSAAGPGSSTPASSQPSAPGGTGGGSTPSGSGGGGGSGDGKSPTYEQFCAAVAAYSKTSAGGQPPKPSKEIYDAFVKYVSSKMSLKEQAMFLANSIWETGGLQYMKEIACSNGSCQYGKYYGRGFIQLTWDYNYREASKDIYGDDSLYNNPDMAATPEGAWRTALWFWNKKVAPVLKQNNAVETYKLGYSIKVINGGLECPANQKAQNRMAIFNEILAQWNIDKNKPGKMEGC